MKHILILTYELDSEESHQRGGQFGLLIGTSLAIFDLQIAQILPTKFRVKWPFDSEEVQNRYSRWRLSRPSCISDRNYFNCLLLFFVVVVFFVCFFFVFFCFFYLQVTSIFATKFRVNWLFG